MKLVLVIDDSPLVRRVVKTFLGTEKYSFEEVTNAKDALNKLFEFEFDLIVSDINMPGMTGLEMLQKIRDKMPNLKTPVIMLTSDTKLDSVTLAKSHGVAAWMIKPFNEEQFLKTVDKVFEEAQAEKKE